MNENDLTREERDALASLPRERQPSDLLEEQTVRALQARGILDPQARRGITLSAGWLNVAIAASVADIAYTRGLAAGEKHTNLKSYIKKQMYEPYYTNYVEV